MAHKLNNPRIKPKMLKKILSFLILIGYHKQKSPYCETCITHKLLQMLSKLPTDCVFTCAQQPRAVARFGCYLQKMALYSCKHSKQNKRKKITLHLKHSGLTNFT